MKHLQSTRTRTEILPPLALLLLSGSLLLHAADAPAAAESQIVIKNFMFAPASLTVKAGSTVTWVNQDGEPHTVASGLFRSGALDTNDKFSFTFDKPGSYTFVCTIHPQMTGTIIVQ